MAEEIEDAKLLSRVMSDMKRLALLGLLPEEGAKISARGEFIVGQSNVEEAEDKKMRSYRHKEYGVSGKMLHAWPEGQPDALMLVVKNRDEEENALAAGWSLDPVHGPGGRLVNGAAVEAEAEVVEHQVVVADCRTAWNQLPGQLGPQGFAGDDVGAHRHDVPRQLRRQALQVGIAGQQHLAGAEPTLGAVQHGAGGRAGGRRSGQCDRVDGGALMDDHTQPGGRAGQAQGVFEGMQVAGARVVQAPW